MKSIKRICAETRMCHRPVSWLMRNWVAVGVVALYLVLGTYFFSDVQGKMESYFFSSVQGELESYVTTGEQFDALKNLFTIVGGALMGATAVVFAFVMFAMQVNVDRMPHGLFRNWSVDLNLFVAFVATFTIAILVTLGSLIPTQEWWLTFATLATGFWVLLIFCLFLYAYRRARWLIDPTEQLDTFSNDACRDLQVWAYKARRATQKSIDFDQQNVEHNSMSSSVIDRHRLEYFEKNQNWTAQSKKAIGYAIAYVRRYAEQGDHEIARDALNKIIEINRAYVQAKGKTFFRGGSSLALKKSAKDDFIEHTLNLLRKNVRTGISQNDEWQIEQTLQTMFELFSIYLRIDYPTVLPPTKTHAKLAVEHLANAMRSVVPHNMPDVLTTGLKLLGDAAQELIDDNQIDNLSEISKSIREVSYVDLAKKETIPVKKTGMEEFAKITWALIRSGCDDIDWVAEQIRDDVSMVVKSSLGAPKEISVDVRYLYPYYGVGADTLQKRLVDAVDGLVDVEKDDEYAQKMLRHIGQWAGGVEQFEEELFLLAIRQRSNHAHIIAMWIVCIAKALMVASASPACDDGTRYLLKESAYGLVTVFSLIGYDRATINFARLCGVNEELFFDVSMYAFNRQCAEVADAGYKMLVEWIFKTSKHPRSVSALAHACYGLATLTVMQKRDWRILQEMFSQSAGGIDANQIVRDGVAKQIRWKIATLSRSPRRHSGIDAAMVRADQEELGMLLEKIAQSLSSRTENML